MKLHRQIWLAKQVLRRGHVAEDCPPSVKPKKAPEPSHVRDIEWRLRAQVNFRSVYLGVSVIVFNQDFHSWQQTTAYCKYISLADPHHRKWRAGALCRDKNYASITLVLPYVLCQMSSSYLVSVFQVIL